MSISLFIKKKVSMSISFFIKKKKKKKKLICLEFLAYLLFYCTFCMSISFFIKNKEINK